VTTRPNVVNPESVVSNRELRDFGLIVGGLIAIIFGLLLPLIHHRPIPWWPWTVAVLLAAAAMTRPALLYHFNSAWNALGKVLGWINSRLILWVLFYAIVTPMGLMARLLSRSRSSGGNGGPSNSYRVASHEVPVTSFEKPF
jgi:Saxitoxin biosynthesis operon protein SxtJ